MGTYQRCTLENLGEHLGIGSKNISGPHPPSVNTAVPLDTQSAQTASPLLTGSHRKYQETSKRSCSFR